jgi:predicted membrane metal-binding protein
MSLWDVGFQMSFLAVFGILAFNERFYYIIKPRYLQSHRVVDWIWTMFKVSMAAQVMVAPIIIYYFGRFSCYFLLANYIAIPAVTLIVYLSLVERQDAEDGKERHLKAYVPKAHRIAKDEHHDCYAQRIERLRFG